MKLTLLLLPTVLLVSTYAAIVDRDGIEVHTLETDSRSHARRHGDGKGNTFDITFFHINDVHAHLDLFRSSGANCTDLTLGCYSGYPSIKATVDFLRPQKKNSLFLNIDDEFQVRCLTLIRFT
jgi:2',3'-cyclic-nucleotide 2'-phosphodiesterase (5'-nucleotidase family)